MHHGVPTTPLRTAYPTPRPNPRGAGAGPQARLRDAKRAAGLDERNVQARPSLPILEDWSVESRTALVVSKRELYPFP